MIIARRGLLLTAAAAGLGAACDAATSTTTRIRRTTLPAPATGAPLPIRAPRRRHPTGPAREIDAGSRHRREVALTFHTAGDPMVVNEILRIARTHRAPLTMLVVGTWLKEYPHFARAIVAGGHDIGNHTWSHPVLVDDDPRAISSEITRCRSLLQRVAHTPGRWFRTSGTPHASPGILAAAGCAGYAVSLGYDVDPLDYTDPGLDAIVSRVLDGARSGSIVSLHTLYDGTAQALPHIITGLRNRGLQPVRASRLLAGSRT